MRGIHLMSGKSFGLLFLYLLPFSLLAYQLPDSTILPLVPRPVEMKRGDGKFTINRLTKVLVSGTDSGAMHVARMFTERIRFSGGPLMEVRQMDKADKKLPAVVFSIHKKGSAHKEGYSIRVTPARAEVSASTAEGLFRGLQTLFQLLPSEISRHNLPMTYKEWDIPSVTIRDYPRYPYRGMHLDVSRHFFPKEFVKRYIDLIAMYRMNTFHWHLTDDNGWRIEIKKYPKLTEIGAWRVDHEDKLWTERPRQQPGEKAAYGGFYTQDEIREIVKYAADRFITVIPEIEMPAHSVEVLAAYPSLSCTGGPFTVPTGSYWPNADIFCAGNDSVFTFLQDVLTEVMELFPSRYIHIGGDEADKAEWKRCAKCQERIKAEGLKDEKELQSYFIKRIEKFVVSKGRRIIGWDEILEGGLAPEATVMSWRGVEGGIAAARMGHDAIMTPGSHCYFDHYQADPESEPKAIGGFTTLKKVYLYEPTPEELTREEARHILGAQGNVWTEYIPTPAHAEYMAVPRMIALAEVTWSPKELRNWDDFMSRMADQYVRLQKMKVNYSRGSFKVEVSTKRNPSTGKMELILSSEQPGETINYTLDGKEVSATSPAYTGPVEFTANGFLRAGIFPGGKLRERIVEMPVIHHKAIGCKVSYHAKYSYRYPASGDGAMTDGLRGPANHRDGFWHGYQGNQPDMVIDLGREMPVNSVQMNFLQNQKSWIFLPQSVEYSLSSDGKKWHSFNEVLHKVSPKEEKAIIQPFNFQFMENSKARYIRVKTSGTGKCPDWHEGAGEPGWIFTDEVVVF